jgi:peptidyl-prolyl cis-trans isomerase C
MVQYSTVVSLKLPSHNYRQKLNNNPSDGKETNRNRQNESRSHCETIIMTFPFHRGPHRRTSQFFSNLVTITFFLVTLIVSVSSAASNGDSKEDIEEKMRIARENAKPWLMRDLTIGDTRLYISPASIICVVVFVVNLCSWLMYKTSGTWAEASHILVKDTSDKTRKALVHMQKEIGGNSKMFADVAEKYSQCPSSKERGNLGRFKQGTMAPPFDRAVFDPNAPLKMTIGPIETQFGLHLIYIRERKM